MILSPASGRVSPDVRHHRGPSVGFLISQSLGPSSFFHLTTVPDDPTCVRSGSGSSGLFCESVKQ